MEKLNKEYKEIEKQFQRAKHTLGIGVTAAAVILFLQLLKVLATI